MSCRIDVHRYFNTERYEHHCHTAPLDCSHWMRNKRLRHIREIRRKQNRKFFFVCTSYTHPVTRHMITGTTFIGAATLAIRATSPLQVQQIPVTFNNSIKLSYLRLHTSSMSSLPPVAVAATETTESPATVTSLFDNKDVMKTIFSFVGKHNKVCPDAAEGGHLDVLVWCIENGCPWESSRIISFCSAAYNGHLLVLQWCRDNGFLLPIDLSSDLCSCAATNGHLNVIQWCREIGCPWDEKLCSNAAENGHMHVLQWCRENGCPWDADVCKKAASNGQLNVLQWCREIGCPWDEESCSSAAENGHLHVLKWCRENGCPWDADVCKKAASTGKLNVLQWCRENGCPWDEWTCFAAAKYGHLIMLQWCRKNGCEWDVDECIAVARLKGYGNIVQWCKDNRIEY